VTSTFGVTCLACCKKKRGVIEISTVIAEQNSFGVKVCASSPQQIIYNALHIIYMYNKTNQGQRRLRLKEKALLQVCPIQTIRFLNIPSNGGC
jgi:hypothetical protein